MSYSNNRMMILLKKSLINMKVVISFVASSVSKRRENISRKGVAFLMIFLYGIQFVWSKMNSTVFILLEYHW